MVSENPLKDLVIRTGVVRRPDLGFLLAGDLVKEEQEIPHTITVKWRAGAWTQGTAKFAANSCCIIENPEYGILKTSGPGIYSLETRAGVTAGNIFDDSYPPSTEARYGEFSAVATVSGKAYAVGFRGMVYRLDGIGRWIAVDQGLPKDFDIEAIHGFGHDDLYAVGLHGKIWNFSRGGWREIESPTNRHLTSVCCAPDGMVYAAGHGGVLIRGRDERWDVIAQEATSDNIWDLEWFQGFLYASTLSSVFRLINDALIVVDFGSDPPKSTYHLTATPEVMWSIGSHDVLSFDGTAWTRIV